MKPASQSVLWRYQTPLYGRDLAQVNADVLYPGIYQGLVASLATGANVNISAGKLLVFDKDSYNTANAKMVKVAFADPFVMACDSGTKPKFIVARFQWVDALDAACDILNVDTVEAYDVVIAALEWNGTSISRVDTASATKGFNTQFDAIVQNIRPVPKFTAARTVIIKPGRFVYGRYSVSYPGGEVAHDASTSGRYDVVGINSSGNVQTIKGDEGGGVPNFAAFLPIYVVNVRVGVANFLGSDLLDVRPFLTFSGVMGDTNIDVDPSGLANISGLAASPTLRSFIQWLDTKLFDGSTVDAGKLAGATLDDSVIGLEDSDLKVPTSKAVIEYVSAELSAALSAATAGMVVAGSAGYIALNNKVAHLITKDIGKVAFFPCNPGPGWLRANGSTIDKAADPVYTLLVDRIKAEVNGDVTHPLYHADPNKAKLPNVVGRYVKDGFMDSDSRAGAMVSGHNKAHAHGGSVVSSENGTPHTHAMPHAHDVAQADLTGASVSGTVDLSHTHDVALGEHDHDLPDLSHSHVVYGKDEIWGSGNPELTAGGASSSVTTSSTDPASGKKVVSKNLGTKTTSLAGSLAKALDLIFNAGKMPAHQTGGVKNNVPTSEATPGPHSHTVTIPSEGGDTVEVDRTLLWAYIYVGVF